ncbi:peptidyl-prolyl cis-trans isomerase [uncultured Desulfuromusa sp.]|uniref:peptidyl-prolyl cis-trans isomerase n=1 Tax=uncultured Desulfuromusa sp. TaxID=219183 RepID=UPI002AA6876F|nr:peptidyl-prolyl cis-trans isomerase [uncultured Desulfuromusa sp.]
MTHLYRFLIAFCLTLSLATTTFAFAGSQHKGGAAPVLGQDLAIQLLIPVFDPTFANLPIAGIGDKPILLKEVWPQLQNTKNTNKLSAQLKQALEARFVQPSAAGAKKTIFVDTNISKDGLMLIEIPLFSEFFPEIPVALVNEEPVTVAEFSEDLQAVHNEMSGHESTGGSKQNIQRLMDRLITARLIEQESRNIGFDQTPSFKKQAEEFAEKSLLYALLNNQLERKSLDTEAVDALYRQISLQGQFENYHFTLEKNAVALLERHKAGEDFDSLISAAITNKQATKTTQQEYLKFKDLLPNIASEAANLEVGGISQIFRQADGFLIFRLTDRQFVEDPHALDYARKNVWERQKSEFASQYTTETVDRYSKFNQAAQDDLDFSKIKENNPNIKLGEALEPLLKDQRVLVTVKGPNPVQITVAQLAQKIKDNYFHGVDIALDAAEVDAKKQEILDDTLFRIAGTFEAQKLGLDQTPRYRMEVAEFERRILFDVFMAKVITPDIRYGEEEIQNYYDKHQADYMTPAMFKFKSLPFYRQADAEKAAAKLQDGSDFKWVSANSEGLVDVQNKDLLQFDRNILSLSSLPASLQQQAAGVKRGDSLVYAEPDNFHYVLYFEDVFPPEPRPYDQVRKELLGIVYQQKVTATLNEWVEKLKEAYETKVFLVAQGR